jgi:1,2-phenylacetyl-CoA epoxidase catalytic subunit
MPEHTKPFRRYHQEKTTMLQKTSQPSTSYRNAMGRLLALYTQADRLIMLACAERIASAPDDAARLGLAQQVGDESRHVAIQQEWMERFGCSRIPVLSAAQELAILGHFRKLDWLDFLTDMYLCVEALGSDAVEQIVPLADPGTKESLRIPLQDELNHIAFGVNRLRAELARLQPSQRQAYLARIPQRISELTDTFLATGIDVQTLFEAVGADYEDLCQAVLARRDEVLREVAQPLAA